MRKRSSKFATPVTIHHNLLHIREEPNTAWACDDASQSTRAHHNRGTGTGILITSPLRRWPATRQARGCDRTNRYTLTSSISIGAFWAAVLNNFRPDWADEMPFWVHIADSNGSLDDRFNGMIYVPFSPTLSVVPQSQIFGIVEIKFEISTPYQVLALGSQGLVMSWRDLDLQSTLYGSEKEESRLGTF